METNNKSIFAPTVRAFLEKIAQETIDGERYSERIELDDGGHNSYVAICVDSDAFNKAKRNRTYGIRLLRHSNSVDHLQYCWEFDLGGIANPYCDNKEIPVLFRTYGVTIETAENEATIYFTALIKQIKKRTSEMKVSAAKSAAEEKEQLLARLKELDD